MAAAAPPIYGTSPAAAPSSHLWDPPSHLWDYGIMGLWNYGIMGGGPIYGPGGDLPREKLQSHK